MTRKLCKYCRTMKSLKDYYASQLWICKECKKARERERAQRRRNSIKDRKATRATDLKCRPPEKCCGWNCQKPGTIEELRPTGPGLSLQLWVYCEPCWHEYEAIRDAETVLDVRSVIGNSTAWCMKDGQ